MDSLKRSVAAYVRRHPESAKRFAGAMPRTGLEVAALWAVLFAAVIISIWLAPDLMSPEARLLLVVPTVAVPYIAGVSGLWVRQTLTPQLTRNAAGFGCSLASCSCRS